METLFSLVLALYRKTIMLKSISQVLMLLSPRFSQADLCTAGAQAPAQPDLGSEVFLPLSNSPEPRKPFDHDQER